MIIRHRFLLVLMLFTGVFFAYFSINHPLRTGSIKALPYRSTAPWKANLEFMNRIMRHSKEVDSNACLLKNEGTILPLNDLEKSTVYLTLGDSTEAFRETLLLYDTAQIIPIHSAAQRFRWEDIKTERLVISIHASAQTKEKDWNAYLRSMSAMPHYEETILILFGKLPETLVLPEHKCKAIVVCPDNASFTQERVAQKIMGAMAFTGKTKASVGSFPMGSGLSTEWNGRLRFAYPEEFGLYQSSFDVLDQLAIKGIRAGAYPSCQIVVAYQGAILYRKAFGTMTYDPESITITNNHLYDIASITKIASSTLAAMHLVHKGSLNINNPLKTYLPELTGSSPYGDISITEMMCHQAGLQAFIPFYKNTLSNGSPSNTHYSTIQSETFPTPVADNLYLKAGYRDSMYAQILSKPLQEKKYLYSDLCYFFLQPILEKLGLRKQESYVAETFYKPMGLRYIGYHPLKRFPKHQIVATENDQYFRKQLLWGHVHDPGAAMLGGVGGHAGLFSNATDLAQIMQLFLTNGRYAGHQFFDETLRKKFTSAVYPGNKRGIGFDRPNNGGGGTCDVSASSLSFGHSGFTGCLAWADPKNQSIFVFLSNRVHPSQDNWKIRDMNIRTDIQHAIYQILAKAR
ncbi:MAG: serine hydrolase domain-containing protein [Flavobacteriales bacterium]